MSATGRGCDRGTTLVEALVVMAIVSLVTLLQFPRIQQAMLAAGRGQAVAAVAARLRQTRADAMLGDGTRRFAVAADRRHFLATGYPPALAPYGVTLESADRRPIVFYGDGSSSGGVVLVDAGRRRSVVRVAADTGAVAADRGR